MGNGPAPDQDGKRRGRSFVWRLPLALDLLAVGGFIALLLVDQVLSSQLTVYGDQNMEATSAILHLVDTLLVYYVAYGALMFLLALLTVATWAWLASESRWVRYPVILVGIAIIVLAVVLWFTRGDATLLALPWF